MTEMEAEAVGHPPASRRLPRGTAVALGVLAGALVSLLVAWPLVAAHQRGQVHVVLDAAALACDDAAVRDKSISTVRGPDVALPVAEITEDMRCLLRVRVENRGLTGARVDGVSARQLGPIAGAGIEARRLPGARLDPEAHETDAVFVFDQPQEVGAGLATEFEVEIRYRPDGCTPDGGGIFFADAPTVAVAVLGLRGERSVVGHAFGFEGTEVSDCGGELRG